MLDQRIQELTASSTPVEEPKKEVEKAAWEPLEDVVEAKIEKAVSGRPSVKLATSNDLPNFSGAQLRSIKAAMYSVGRSEAVREARLSPGLPFVEPFVLPVIGKHSVIILTTFRDDDGANSTEYYNCSVNGVFLGKDCHIQSPLILKDPIDDREMYFYDGSIRGEKLNCFAVHAVDGALIHFWKASVVRGDRITPPGGIDLIVRVTEQGVVSFVSDTSRSQAA
jgi:hypothetical protein